jgi:phenylpyruvate tautomerase PptA (4-oxalocrotonate tautomerase family)
MPYVNIRIAGTLSPKHKAKTAAEITDTLAVLRISLKQPHGALVTNG